MCGQIYTGLVPTLDTVYTLCIHYVYIMYTLCNGSITEMGLSSLFVIYIVFPSNLITTQWPLVDYLHCEHFGHYA
jgi:hypothetical protein